ncbi:mycofactocin system glycosyltransferase [Saccharopolyspora kobensis]|uniref:Mycofactocin system glycosyltransferase n=1 Tax=Saccharopolyspora kobensis TaxID=146035 RepID=A0A1H5VSN3_9PSEU|nr:mycofactocin biosynthesis glycosyltransferase MftF [Saccharopolyspora kobensis]SEF90153.1 mycofactocin system glycosyltransferase [Saccharopolyspora kobensis]SFC57586.1 mycofactocin system glycosyltransferase [Saccharopolyspora kobensis]
MTLRLAPDPGLRRFADGRALAGGSPFRVLRLSAAGARLVDRWFAGEPVTAGAALAKRLVGAGMAHPRYEQSRFRPEDVTAVLPVRDDQYRAPDSAIVVDDGSRHPVPGASVRHPVPRGPAAARNSGLRLVTTPLVAFLDADVEAAPGWLEPLLSHFEDPDVVAVAPRVRSVPGSSALDRYETARSPLDLGDQPGLVQPGSRISYVPSAALVVRTDVLREAGGFDENLRFGEDVDLIWRLVQQHRIRYEPASTVHHRPRRTWTALLRQRFSYGTSAGPLATRHGTAVAPVRTSLWSAAAWALLGTRRITPALAVTSGAAVLLARKLGKIGVPVEESLRLTALGTLGAGRYLADAIGRPWAPLAIPLLAMSRGGRRVLTAVALRHLLDWFRERPPLDPVSWTLARLADDAAYGCGVLCGAFRSRTATPLLPVLSNAGGRSSVPTERP